ncbi:HNH endonuclease [Chromohalobacter israelensis]|uniref:HNH endonuclease n=1 Tax=Chromohalobacter israelensis TaxID=141390 RepID=UPI000A04F628|nr:HNH endonuclease signature motif containing protein [Chromohalobacter israelensis]MDF9433129.1 HNH endonuclease [Chromohalobacter israelensis]
MSKKVRNKKRKEEAGRLGEIRRRIEDHQNKIGATTRDKRVAWQVAENIHDDVSDNDDDLAVDVEAKRGSEPSSDDEVHFLWVFEPEDLDGMSIEQVDEVWKHREQLCGSKEAAAEALAIVEASAGVVESYQGWQAYVNRDEVVSLKAPFLSDDSEQSYARVIEKNALTRAQVLELGNDDLKAAWKNRPNSFSSVQAACQALALLRERAGVVAVSNWQGVMSHPEIEKIKDDLPVEAGLDDFFEDVRVESKGASSVDLRKRAQRIHVVREGQRDFRLSVIDNYYGGCCITNSGVVEVLEAAHISPYSGPQSNRLDNSLCLRVDIHRLFDKFLLSIDPESNVVRLSDVIKKDRQYGELEGLQVTKGRVKASKYLLSQHFRTFVKRQVG